MWNPEFEGWYFKHQKGRDTVAFIPGQAKSGAFVQVIWPEGARCFPMPALHVDRKGERVYAPGCRFGRNGISVDLPGIRGEISYGPLTPLRSDIMGPFRFFPMECRHGVLSMGHRLRGSLELPGRAVDFDGGLGYLEKDSGRSFPKSYLWLQCSDFSQPCSIFLSLARIPFCGLVFPGCICAVHFGGREYRFATYEGVKLLETGPGRIVLGQGTRLLEIFLLRREQGHALKSPAKGLMTGMIRECNRAKVRFRFLDGSRLLFDLTSENASLEAVPFF